MKILKIVNSADKGGIFTLETQFIKGLREMGVVVDAVIIGSGENLEAYQNMCDNSWILPALNVNYSGSPIKVLISILVTYKYGKTQAANVKSRLGSVPYDAIIYQRPTFIHLAGMLSGLLNTKSFWHLPNTVNSSFSRKYYNYFCEKYGIVQVANSLYTKETLGKQCKHVVYPGYDSTRLTESKMSYSVNLGLNGDTPVYGIASRMCRDKAQDIVVEAFVNSKVWAAGGHLLIAGGPLNSDFGQMVQKKAGDLLNKQVHFLGQVERMSDFYASVDVIINGRRNAEPFGISVAEAMGAGKPVIAYYLGGPSEMLTHNESGWLIQEPTVAGYQAAFDTSLERREKWAAMGANAKAGAGRFTVQNNVNKLVDIIRTERAK